MYTLDIEVYEKEDNAQAKYLVHGHDDVYWTNDIDEAAEALRISLRAIEDRRAFPDFRSPFCHTHNLNTMVPNRDEMNEVVRIVEKLYSDVRRIESVINTCVYGKIVQESLENKPNADI